MARYEYLNIGELNYRSIKAPDELTVNVSQATNRTTGVTASGVMGVITGRSDSLAAGAEATFTVTNTRVTATSVVLVSLQSSGAAPAGPSVPEVTTTAAGSFKITLSNLGTDADTTAAVINYMVFNGSSI